MKIASWNVNSLRIRLPQIMDWLEAQQPDILGLQETKTPDAEFPVQAFAEAGWQVVFSGQKAYNGVAFISKQAPADCLSDPPGWDDPQRRILAASFGDLRVVDLYIPNGSEVGSDKYAYKLDWLEKMRVFLREELARYPRLAVLGDFNIAPEDRDAHDPDAWRGKILCSEPERAAFQAWLDLGLSDAFRLFEQAEASFSWWDYRAAGFRRNMGLRIDHILLSDALKAECSACSIDKAPRGLERPSDHAPVWASFGAA
jgi:exodeoxyribonuclease-3